jgi:hypothetical protein
MERIRNKKTKFLLNTRPSLEGQLTNEKKKILRKFKLKRLEQENFIDIAEKIIVTYSKKNEKIKKHFIKKARESIIKAAKGNLWILSYFIKGWTPESKINRKILHEEVIKDIENLEKEFEEKYGLDGVQDALLSLAPFSRFEIGVSEIFFDEQLGSIKINLNTLKKLKEYGEVKLRNGFYFIPHSTLAQLYLETAMFGIPRKKYFHLFNRVKKQLKVAGFSGENKQYILDMFKMYLSSNPSNLDEFMHRLGGDPEGYTRYLHRLLQNKEIYATLIHQINQSENLDEIIKCVNSPLDENIKIKILKDIDWNVLYSKIKDSELWEIYEFISNTDLFSSNLKYKKMIYKIVIDNLPAIKSKLKKASKEERMKFTILLAMKPLTEIMFPLSEFLDLPLVAINFNGDVKKLKEDWKKINREIS